MFVALCGICHWLGLSVLCGLLCWLAWVVLTRLRPRSLLHNLPARAVLITGCDSGFGHGLARCLDSLGVPVLAGCLSPEGCGARALATHCSSRLRLLPLDVTSDQQVADAVTSVRAMLKDNPGTELWAVVNNAGTADFGEINMTPLEKFQRVLDVNTVGAIRVTKAFLPLLKRSKGRVINVTSPYGRIPFPMAAAYCLSKSALLMFSDVLRLEMKKYSVTVSTVDPAGYKTPIMDTGCLKSKIVDNAISTELELKEEQETMRDAESILRWLKWLSRGDISEVVDEMVAACVGRDPQRRHFATFRDAIFFTTLGKLPGWLLEFVIELFVTAVKVIWK